MAAARVGVRGLSEDDLATIRDGLGAGRRPRVMFTAAAGQVAGQIGQVVSLLDPARADDWVMVRFGRDELPFSPSDLQVAPKGAVARKAAPAPPPPAPARPEPEFVIDKPLPSAARSRRAGAARSADAGPAGPVSAASGAAAGAVPSARSAESGVTPARAVEPASGDGEIPAGEARAGAGRAAGGPTPAPRKADPAAAGRKPARGPKAKPVPSLTVTLAYADGEWTVAATQGSKALARPYVVRPVEALRMVALVDVPGVREAVEQIMSAERAEAEQEATRLRAELADIEARLAELRDAG
jgi:hypothetical protein